MQIFFPHQCSPLNDFMVFNCFNCDGSKFQSLAALYPNEFLNKERLVLGKIIFLNWFSLLSLEARYSGSWELLILYTDSSEWYKISCLTVNQSSWSNIPCLPALRGEWVTILAALFWSTCNSFTCWATQPPRSGTIHQY